MTAFFFRTIRALVAAFAGAALVGAPSKLAAQGRIRVAAVVSAPQTYEVRRDTIRRIQPLNTVRLPEGLLLTFDAGAGSVVRALPSDTTRTVRITVDYTAS